MSDAQARILIQAEMNDRLSAALQRINGQLSNTVRSLNGLKATSQSAVGATNAVGAAITQLSRHSNSLNGSLRGNVLSQHALSVSFKNSAAQANALQMQLSRLRSNGLDVTPLRAYISQLRVMNSMQKQVGNSMRAMNFQQMGTQLNAFSQRMTNAGTRMSMGLTLPLVAFFRMGFSSFRALDKQVIRSTKLMADSFDDSVKNTTGAAKGYTDLQYAVKTLGDGLDKITSKWGISRELVQGLAGDFAELGISAPESLARLTELTVEFEKLGNIDITQAQSTIQAMFQTISRIRTDKGLDVTSSASLKQMTEEIDGAIAFFNFAENKTTLSLNNIAEAFPEVTAAATSFGLNMQTTAALLVPMIGASFQVGASANSIKVSLQRMVATTKQNKQMLEDLSKTIGDKFVPSLGLGSTGLLDLIRNYDLLKEKMSKADQLIFFSKLFGVRQGPRMEVAIAQMNKYSKSLEKAGTKEREMAQDAENAINAQLKLAGFTDKKDKIKIKNIVDIANLTSAAQEMDKDGNYTSKALTVQAGQEVALFNLRNKNQALIKNGVKQYDIAGRVILDNTKKQQKQNKAGEEFNDIQTESGKLFQAQIFGKAITEDNKNDELRRVQNSVEVSYGRAREAAKSIARELTSVFAGILEQVNPIIERVAKFFRELSDPFKKILGVMLILLALIGPLMRTIGAVGQLGALFNNARAGGIKRFKGNVVELNQSLMKTSDIALRIGGNFKKFGQDGKIFTSRKDAKRLEKLAPIMAKVDAKEDLTPKEKAKGTKYIKKLAGREAVLDKTALLPQGVQNLKGLDMATRDYIKSLDPIAQADKVINELLADHSKKKAGILRKAAARVLKIRPASNNSITNPIYPTPTGGPIPPPIYPTPTGAPIAAVTAPIVSLRDILTQILASIQAIQACVCNAKAAATGRPSPAASGAPAHAPPAGMAAPTVTQVMIRPRVAATTGTPASTVTPVTLGQKPAATTGTPAPTGAAVAAVTGPITAATVATKQAYAELVLQSPLMQKLGGTLKDFVLITKIFSLSAKQAIAKGAPVNGMFAAAKQLSQDAVLTKVLLEKYGIDINKVVDQYRQAVVDARNNLVAGARPVAPAGVPATAVDLSAIKDPFSKGASAGNTKPQAAPSFGAPVSFKTSTGGDLSKLSDKELADSKARLEKEAKQLEAESKETAKILAKAEKEKRKLAEQETKLAKKSFKLGLKNSKNPFSMESIVGTLKPQLPTPAQSLPANFMNPMAMMNAMKPTMPEIPAGGDILKPAIDKGMHAVAEAVMVSIGKKPVAPAASPIPAAIEAAATTAEEAVATDVKEKAKRGRRGPKAAGPIPAAVDAAVVEAEKVVAETIVAGAKPRGGRVKGSVNKPKPIAAPFMGDYGIGYAKAIAGVNQAAGGANADLEAAGASIKKLLNLEGTSKSAILTKDSLIRLFKILGQEVPEKLRQLDSLVDKQGNAIKVNLGTLGKIAGAIKTGVAGKALSPDAKAGAAFTGSSAETSPFYVKKFNQAVSTSVGNRKSRAFTAIQPEDVAVAKESNAQAKLFENERQILGNQIKILADQSRVINKNIVDLQLQNAAAKSLGDLALSRALAIAIAKEKAEVRYLQGLISDLKRNITGINTELQSVRQAANVAFNNAQQQIASSGGIPFAGAKGKGMPFGSNTARTRAKRTGERYMSLAYGGKESDAYIERTQVARPSYSRNAPEEKDRQARRDALAPKRQTGINLAKIAATQQPGYIAREKRRAAQEARDAEFAKKQSEALAAKREEFALKKAGVEPVKVQAVEASPVKRSLMPRDQFLAGQAENLKRINEDGIAALNRARDLKATIANLETQIQETVNSKKRIKGGKKNAIDEITTKLENAKRAAEQANAAVKDARAKIDRINAYDPAKGGLPPKPGTVVAPVAPSGGGGSAGGTSMFNDPVMGMQDRPQPRGRRIPRNFGPKLASMDKGGIIGGVSTVYGEIQTALKIPADIMQQVIKDLAVKHAQITGVGKAAVTQINGSTSGVIEELKKSIVDPANATVAEIKKAITDARVKFAKLETEALKTARLQAEAAKAATLGTPTPTTTAAEKTTTATKKTAKKPAGKSASTADQNAAVAAVMQSINDTKKATDEFLRFTDRPLRKLAEQIRDKVKNDPALQGKDIIVDPKAPMELRRQQIVNALSAMGVAVEKAIITEAINPINATTDAVKKTTAAKNPYLANIKASGPALPIAKPDTQTVALPNPYSRTEVGEINKAVDGKGSFQNPSFSYIADSISLSLRLVEESSIKHLRGILNRTVAITKSINAQVIGAEFKKLSGMDLGEYIKILEQAVQKKILIEAEKVKQAAVTAAASTGAASPPMLMLNAAKESRMALAQAKAKAAAAGTVGVAPIPMPTTSALPAGFMNPLGVMNAMKPVTPRIGGDAKRRLHPTSGRVAEMMRNDLATGLPIGAGLPQGLSRNFAFAKKVSHDADYTKILLEKYGVDIYKVIELYRKAVVEARNNLAASVKPIAPVVSPVSTPMPTIGPKGSGVNVSAETQRRLNIARNATGVSAVPAPAVPNAMAERIRNNVAISQAIRERSAAKDAANRADAVARRALDTTSIASVPTPTRPSTRVAPPSYITRREMPKTVLARTGEVAKTAATGVISTMFNPMTTIRGIVKTGGLIGAALEGVAKKVSPKRFGSQDVYKARDYGAEARKVTYGARSVEDPMLGPITVKGRDRQRRLAERESRVVAKETRATDRPNRNITQLTQTKIPSQFRQTINPTIDTFKAIAKIYIPKLKAAEYIAKTVAREGLIVAAQITKEIIYLPKTVPVMFTKAVIEAHKLAMQGIRAGVAALESMTFFQTTRTGKSLLFLAKTIETGLTRIGAVATSAGQGLVLAGQTAAKFVTTAFTNPKQALAMASTGLTNSKDLLFKAGAGLIAASSSIKTGAIRLAQSAVSATVAGGKMAGGAVVNAAMAPVRGVQTMLVGGKTFVDKGQDAAGNAIATKKGGLFRRSVTQTTDATTGVVTEQRGKGMMGRMKGGMGRGLMGGIKGLGTAAGSMSSMMLYQLGPAGMALQGPLNKVIGLLTKTKLAFFGVTLPILLVVGAIFLLKKTFSAYGDKTTGVAENFKKAFAAIMVVVNMLKTAFFDFFASLFGGAESSGQATGNIATTVTKVAEATRKFAVAFQAFFEKYILPAIYSMLSGFSMIIKGIFSFISNLVKFVVAIVSFFRGGGDKAKEAMVGALKGMLRAIVNVLKGILKQWLPILTLLIKAVTKVVELIVQLFEWLVIGVINLIRYMVKGVINLVFTIIKAYVFIIDKIIDLFVLLETTVIKIATALVIAVIKIFFGIVKGTVAVVKGIISIWAKLPEGIGKGIGMIANLISGLIRGIGDKLGEITWIGPKLKKALYSVADGFETAGNAVQGVGEKTTAALESGVDAIFTPVEKAIGGIENKAIGLVKGISGALITGVSSLGGVGDAVGRVAQGIQNKLLEATDIAADTGAAFVGGFSDAIAGAGNGISDWLAGLVDGNDIKQGIGDSIKDAVKNVAKDPSAANEAGRSIAKSIGEGIKSLKDNFYDKVISNLSDSLGKLKDQVTKALEKQKDQSLKFFDDQIAAIDALAAADAELTAEKQKQEDERLRIAERALQRDSFLKNRALAIYEGRIDDARTMGLEEAKNQQEFNKTTEKNAKDAQAAAKAKNVDAAKQVITNQKEAASIQFDSVLEDYQAFLENVGRNGTLTQAELTTQFNELRARASLASTDMQTAFQGYYNALPGLITANTEPTVGFFTGSMDTLIAAAQGKFGLDANSTDPASLLGVTNGMLGNMGLAYTNGFAAVVAPAYNDGQESLADIAREFADPSATNPKSAAGIYATAIANATAAVRAEFMKMKTDASSAFAEVVAAINEELRGLAITKAISDAVEEIKNTGGGTPPSGGSATSPATGVTGPTAPTGFGPTGFGKAGFETAAGIDKIFKLNDSSNYIKTAKAALAFYGYSGFDVNSERMGTGTVAALKGFQEKYNIGSGSGNLGHLTANALGLFSNVGVQKKFMGGMIKKAAGGVVPGYSTEGVPAILHGGEYVISSKAVQNLGLGLLTQINGLKHGVPSFNVPKPQMPSASGMNMNVTSHSQSETTQNYNFYVDNFIGEDQWFESMMKDYNIKVVPNNQKAAGLESRVVRTYNGINRGM
jgi:phage-related protein